MNLVQDTRLVPGILTGALGAFLLWHGSRMPHPRGWASSPGLFPIIIGSVLLILAALLLVERARHASAARKAASSHPDNTPRPAEIPEASGPFLKGDLLAVISITAGLVTYIVALAYLPYEPVTFVYLIIGMWAFGARSPAKIVLAAGTFTLVIVLLFTQVLGMLIPGTSSLIETLLQ